MHNSLDARVVAERRGGMGLLAPGGFDVAGGAREGGGSKMFKYLPLINNVC